MFEKTDITVITKQLLASPPTGIYVLYGGEEFLKRHFLSDLKNKLLPEGAAELNYSEFYGADVAESVSDACSTLPQFSERRLVVWFNSSFPSMQNKYKAGIDGALSDAAGYPYLTLVLYLNAAELDCTDNREIAKAENYKLNGEKLKATKLFFDFLSPRKLCKWVSRHFSAEKLNISDADSAYLAERCGGDMYALSGQIQKLCVYVARDGRDTATRADIDALVPSSAAYDSFFINNCVRTRDVSGLLGYLDEAQATKEPALIILSRISKEINGIYAAKCAKKDGMSYLDYARAEKIKEYPAKLAYASASEVTEKYLRGLIRRCYETDVALKRFSGDDYGLLRQLVCEL